jgi:hypothetical protein
VNLFDWLGIDRHANDITRAQSLQQGLKFADLFPEHFRVRVVEPNNYADGVAEPALIQNSVKFCNDFTGRFFDAVTAPNWSVERLPGHNGGVHIESDQASNAEYSVN